MAVVLLDLDGTLTDTAHDEFKPLKDGQADFSIANIPILPGAKTFVDQLKVKGHVPLIISDSHPKYVNLIAHDVFQTPALHLADKPNASKTRNFLQAHVDLNSNSNFFVVGDTWLDIELGRALNFPTVLTNFYTAKGEDPRDGIGQDWKRLKSGPTFSVDTYNELLSIIESPLTNLLAIEARFADAVSFRAAKFKTQRVNEGFIAYRSLARQSSGECDIFGAAKQYFEFQRPDRSLQSLEKIASAVGGFLEVAVNYTKWDVFTYVSDKATTIPPNKMQQLFEMIDIDVEKRKLFHWKSTIQGSIKNQKTYSTRSDFVKEYLEVENVDLNGKSIIIVDDQFTTGATANVICQKLLDKGAKNILFVTLFYLITGVESERVCPNCGTQLQVKVNRSKGSRFLSCVPPKYGGKGCGNFIENLQ